MSHQSDTLPVPSGQMRGQLLEMMLHLHLMQLTSRQGLPLEEQKHTQAIREQEALLGHLMATSGLELQVPLPSQDSRGDVRYGQGAQLLGQSDPVPQLSDYEAVFVSRDLSNCGINISVFYQSSFQDYSAYQKDSYHKDKNTSGFINLGTSENKLCIHLTTERLQESDMNCIEDVLLQYPDWRGQPFLREDVAQFLTCYCKAPEKCGGSKWLLLCLLALAMVLCDPGEAFLVPAPFYSGSDFSSCLYMKVELVPVHLESEITVTNTHPFQLTVNKLEEALLEARLEQKKVQGLVLINLQNPVGDIYSPNLLMEYLEFAKRYHLHVIIDEIYMLSVFDESITFHSVLSMKTLLDHNRTHVIWGASKDFGISGFLFGALYTRSKEVASAVSTFGYLHSISGIAQHKLCQLLRNTEWVDKVYLPTNPHKYITAKLKALRIPFHNCSSGLYGWINLKKYLDPCTSEEEQLLSQAAEPGRFHRIFADEFPRIKLAVHQFRNVLQEQKRALVVKQLEDVLRE
uniref:Aminotransferase class I/classII large domain-containing protein n=1 Tax=Aotus nancymaae TaxID=37293 RepID=A0A2K5D0D3_AOTNA